MPRPLLSVQESMFDRDHPPTLVSSLTLITGPEAWSVGAEVVNGHTLETIALGATLRGSEQDLRPHAERYLDALVQVLEGAARAPFE